MSVHPQSHPWQRECCLKGLGRTDERFTCPECGIAWRRDETTTELRYVGDMSDPSWDAYFGRPPSVA